MLPDGSKPHLRYIDCIRGYAVLMVITCHLTYMYPQLPYPVHRLTTSGWYGVQLFFLASCVTLLMSWRYEVAKNGAADTAAFFIRRFFRIAPAYYLAGVFYYVLSPPPSGFDARQLLTSMTFINAWHPAWTPTIDGAWNVVPGGWSISVEFAFYLLFPMFAAYVTSLRRALLVFVGCVMIGLLANRMAFAALHGAYAPAAVDNFLFFWFPNEMSVFALGGVLFFVLQRATAPGGLRSVLERHATLFGLAAFALFGALAYVPLGHYLGASPVIPGFLAVCLPLGGLVVALSSGRGLLVNRFAAAMGQVSFSAYLLHFAALQLFVAFPQVLHTQAVGYGAILALAGGWLVIVLITYAAAWLLYRGVEQPMIAAGKTLIRARRAALTINQA